MKFIHIADMHFDTPFTVLNLRRGLGDIRRLEQRDIFVKVIDYIKKEKIPFLFISGDLYEQNYIRKTTIEFINNLFKEILETKIFISPGNHDPFLKNSYYNTLKWSSNVYIFNSEIKTYEFKEADIYGFGFDDFYCTNSQIENIKIKNKEKTNILVAHGSINASQTSEMQYNPLNERRLKEIGFDYIALGHIHKRMKINNNIIYPGSIISFGFDELDEHGMIEVELNKKENKYEKNNLKIKFIKLDERIFEEKNINISEINTEEELIEEINKLNLENKKMYKIILEGNKNIEIDTIKLCKLSSQKNIIKIKDNTHIKFDLDKLSKENNLKGFFIKEMLEMQKLKVEDENVIKKAIEIGLNIL